MPASIEVTLHQTPGGPVVGPVTLNSSRDDLRRGYQVVVRSFFAAASYNWTLAFTPYSVGPTSVDPNNYNRVASAATFLPPEGDTQQTAKFNIDWEGAYLVRLVIDAGLPTEDVQFVRLRELTKFGKIKLVSAGERRDQTGIIPVDATADGWADDQNQNLQRLTTLVRRMSTSGRVLYVDANRGRDNFAGQNDPNNVLRIPGTDAGLLDETGIRIAAEGFADFSSINDAINYATAAASRGEPAPSINNPYWIVIRAGLYVENLVLQPHIHLCSPEPTGTGGTII